jgi:hypothetical protein
VVLVDTEAADVWLEMQPPAWHPRTKVQAKLELQLDLIVELDAPGRGRRRLSAVSCRAYRPPL